MFHKQIQEFGAKPRSLEQDQSTGKPVKQDLSEEERALLDKIVELYKAGDLNLNDPASIFNASYEKLSEEEQEKLDQKASILINYLRHIIKHYEEQSIDTENMTMGNLLDTVLMEKENFNSLLKF